MINLNIADINKILSLILLNIVFIGLVLSAIKWVVKHVMDSIEKSEIEEKELK